MSRLEGGLHGLKADPSARANDQDCRHGAPGRIRGKMGGRLEAHSKSFAVVRRASYAAAKRERCSSMTNSAQECLLRSWHWTRAAFPHRRSSNANSLGS